VKGYSIDDFRIEEREVLRMIRIVLICLFILFQSGCNKTIYKEQEVQQQLEKFESVDANMQEPQQELLKLEEEEKQVYEQLVALRVDEHTQMKVLTDQAKALLDQRKEMLEKERAAVQYSHQEFQQIDPFMKEVANEQAQQEWEKMKEVMGNRYSSYEELYSEYDAVLKEGGELYNVFLHSPLQVMEVENQIKKIDEKYKRLAELNQSFNNWTEKYYKEKNILYEKMGEGSKELEVKK
jgi:Putative cell-wall binding lipoprotein